MQSLPGQEEQQEETIIEGNWSDISDVQDDLDRELDAIFADFGGSDELDEYEIRVYRTQVGKGTLGYVFACLPHELPILDKLRDEYGGGDFEVRIYKNKKIFRRRKVCVEPPLNRAEKPQQGHSDILALANTMNAGFNRMIEHLNQAHTPAIDPVTMQTSMLQNLISMKELLSGSPPPDSLAQLKSLVEVQKMLLDNSGNSGGGAGASDVLLSLADNILPQLAKMGEEEQQFQHEQQRKVQSAKQPSRRLQQPGQPQPQQQRNPMQNNIIFLTQMAKLNVDPEIYAQVVIDNTPIEELPALIEFVSSKNAMEEIAKIYQPAAAYSGWFGELGDCVLELLSSNTPDQSSVSPHTNNHAAVQNTATVSNPQITGTQIFNVPAPGQKAPPSPANSAAVSNTER